MIPYGRQSIDEDDIQAVVEVLKSDFLTSGPRVQAFEDHLADYCGAAHAVAAANGTAALHLAMLAADLKAGDRVLTSPITFLASANCAEFVGATADFADIDPQTLCLSIPTLEAAWKEDVKAVVAVDFAGYPCISRELADWVHDRGALLIEDACHALGGSRDGHRVGGLPWVDMTTFSFHPVKTMTTGEGGAILTGRTDFSDKLRRLRNHGMCWDACWEVRDTGELQDASTTQPAPPEQRESAPWLYTMSQLGFNYRITDMQCALGLSQLRKLNRFVERRRSITERYNRAFRGLAPIRTPPESPAGSAPAWHLYVVQIDFDEVGTSRRSFMQALKDRGVASQVHYIPVHLQPYYRGSLSRKPPSCPEAESYYRRTLSLPLYPSMSDDQVDQVIHAMKELL